MTEALDTRQNCSLRRLLAMHGTTHSWHKPTMMLTVTSIRVAVSL